MTLYRFMLSISTNGRTVCAKIIKGWEKTYFWRRLVNLETTTNNLNFPVRYLSIFYSSICSRVIFAFVPFNILSHLNKKKKKTFISINCLFKRSHVVVFYFNCDQYTPSRCQQNCTTFAIYVNMYINVSACVRARGKLFAKLGRVKFS